MGKITAANHNSYCHVAINVVQINITVKNDMNKTTNEGVLSSV